MWYVAEFRPTTLFSLRPANATTSGGKTLLTPTPFSIKMALLDTAIRVYGRDQGEIWFPNLRDLFIAVQLPTHVMVINTFIKILRPHKTGPKDTTGLGLNGPMGNTIAYRELVQFGGSIWLALQDTSKGVAVPPLESLLAQIHYLGKRGSFMQFCGVEQVDELPGEYIWLNSPKPEPFSISGTLQLLDDCGPKMTFAHADIFSGKSLSVGEDNGRLLRPVVLPYRLTRSSRGYSFYERLPGEPNP
jgi:hypothetical protein